jgi:hypothetical protein
MLANLIGLTGCAEPIVLRPPPPEYQAMRHAPPHGRSSASRPDRARNRVQTSPAPRSPVLVTAPSEELAGPERRSSSESDAAASVTLSVEQKESLFRDFDDYLRRSGSHSEKLPGAAMVGRPGSSTAVMAASEARAAQARAAQDRPVQDHPAPGD